MDPLERAKRDHPTGWHKERRDLAALEANYHRTHYDNPYTSHLDAHPRPDNTVRLTINLHTCDIPAEQAQEFAQHLLQQANLSIAMSTD